MAVERIAQVDDQTREPAVGDQQIGAVAHDQHGESATRDHRGQRSDLVEGLEAHVDLGRTTRRGTSRVDRRGSSRRTPPRRDAVGQLGDQSSRRCPGIMDSAMSERTQQLVRAAW